MFPIHPSLFQFPIIVIILVLIFSGGLITSFSTDDIFSDCNKNFTCGSIVNLSYPFTGVDRPAFCGPPEFHLSCRSNYPELTISSLVYRILHINQTLQTLTLARLDLWNNTCPNEFFNSTVDFTNFNYGANNVDLTLFYGCTSSAMTINPHNQFKCNTSGNSTDSYYLIGPIPSDPVLQIITCTATIKTPILAAASLRIQGNLTSFDNFTSLGEALTEGFNLNYTSPSAAECSMCVFSGGQCGYDPDSSKFACFCGDQLCPTIDNKNKNEVSLGVGLGIAGAGIVGLGLGFLFFRYRQKRKQLDAEAKSKDLPTPPSSKGIPTPTTQFTRSIPSFPSSNTDFAKSNYFGVQVFDYTELEEATNNFDPSRELGDGGFGTVYYGNLLDGRVVAVKRLYENNFKRVEQFMNEVEILTRLRHKNLVVLFGCTSRKSRELLLVYEYIPNGTVADHLHGSKANSGLLTWPVRLSIAIETADALAYLHASDIIHRDVKTNNILLDNDFRVKVADFGLSRLFPTDVTHVSTAPQGTPGYVDPEYYQCYQLTDKSDVYSFGVVLMELISSKPAVDTNRHRHDINLANMAVNKIQNLTLHELIEPSLGFETDYVVKRMTTAVAELAFRCLQQEKDMRPSMEEVLEGLRAIQNEDFSVQKAEVVDIRVDEDAGLLKNIPNPPPLSPDSGGTDKWVSSSTAPNSF